MSGRYLSSLADPCVVCRAMTGYFTRTEDGDVYAHARCAERVSDPQGQQSHADVVGMGLLKTAADKLAAAVDPAFEARTYSVPDTVGGAVDMRRVMREYAQLKATEALLEQQKRTNTLLEQLVAATGGAVPTLRS